MPFEDPAQSPSWLLSPAAIILAFVLTIAGTHAPVGLDAAHALQIGGILLALAHGGSFLSAYVVRRAPQPIHALGSALLAVTIVGLGLIEIADVTPPFQLAALTTLLAVSMANIYINLTRLSEARARARSRIRE